MKSIVWIVRAVGAQFVRLVSAQTNGVETVVVVGTAPLSGGDIDPDKVPAKYRRFPYPIERATGKPTSGYCKI